MKSPLYPVLSRSRFGSYVLIALGALGLAVAGAHAQSPVLITTGASSATALTFDPSGNLYIAESGLSAVYELPSGSTTLTAYGASSFTAAAGVVWTSFYNQVAVSGNSNGLGAGIYLDYPGFAEQLDAGLLNPTYLAIDAAGDFFVADTVAQAVYEIPFGSANLNIVASGFSSVSGVACDAAGNVYVADNMAGTITKVYDPAGADVQLPFASGLSGPQQIAFDGSGNLFVANAVNGTVSEINPSGAVSTYISSSAGIIQPTGLAFDPSGHLWVSDYFTGYIYALLPAPTVTAVSPTAASPGSTPTVTVTGTNLTGATYVTINGTNVLSGSFTASSGTSISFVAPSESAGVYDVTVTTAAGTSATSSADQITFETVPTVTSVAPVAAPLAGGTTLTITGTNFADATQIAIGSQVIPSSSFTLNGSTSITVTAPAESAGVVDVTVTTPLGTSSTGASDQLTYEAAPTITAVSPNGAAIAGGTVLTITGTHFTGATTLTIGTQSLTAGSGFTVNSSTSITATAPAASAGAVDITVTTPGGTSSTGTSDQVVYETTPTVTAVSPLAASTGGGTSLTITGTNFTGASQVAIGGQTVSPSGFTVNSSTSITVTSAPAQSAGVVDVTVTNPAATSATSSADQITYEAVPAVTSVSPVAASIAGGTVLTVHGNNFTAATQVAIGGQTIASNSFTLNGSTTITVTAPAESAGLVDVTVTTPIGTSSTGSGDRVTFEGAPTVTGLSATSGVPSGGTVVTLTGTNFVGASAVKFGTTPASFTFTNASTLVATAPAGYLGAVDLTVTTPGGTSAATAADRFTYALAAPIFDGATTAAATVGQSFSYQIASLGNAASFTATGLPAGLTLNSGSGQISGTPTTAGTYAVALTLSNSAGASSSATVTITVAGPALIAQSITFPALPTVSYSPLPVALLATASSGLPVSYTVTGPATLSGSILTLTGTGTVTVQASQAGNATYAPATPVSGSFTVLAPAQLSYFGTIGGGSTGSSAGSRLAPAAATTNIAASIAASGTSGTLLGYIASLNAGFVAYFTIATNGTFSTTAATLVTGSTAAQTLNLAGTVTSTAITGTIAGVGVSFSLAVDPVSGSSASVTGLYSASTLQSSSGGTYSIVGSQNDVFVLYASPSVVSFGTGTLSSDTFTVAGSSSATITGTINPATTGITGTVTTPSTGTTTYTGVAATTAPDDRLINLSTRGVVTPTASLTSGFVITGTTAKTVVLRAVGPGLTSFGVTGALAHPTLTLLNSAGTAIASNTGWGGAANLSTAFAAVGAFSLPAGSADSAILTTLAPGKYTMQVTDAAADGGGVAMAEIYDDSIDLTGATQKLVNLSSLGQVGTGSSALVAGFIVQGNDTKEVLIRGVGPSLAAFGVAGLISNPVLNLYNSSGALIAQNSGWGTPVALSAGQVAASAAQIAAAAVQVGAFPLVSGSTDSALLVTLAPGSYTAQVSNSTGAGGTCLVEIYEVSP